MLTGAKAALEGTPGKEGGRVGGRGAINRVHASTIFSRDDWIWDG